MKKILLLIVSLLLLVGCGKEETTKELVCVINNKDQTVTTQQVIATFNEEKLENLEMTVSTKIPDENMASLYTKSLQESAEKSYEGTDSVSVNTKVEGEIVSLITNINYKTFSENDEKVISIAKESTFDDLKTRFEKMGYVCE